MPSGPTPVPEAVPEQPPQAAADSSPHSPAAGTPPPKERWRLVIFCGLLLVLVGLALAWSNLPLKEWLDMQKTVASLRAGAQFYGPYLGTAGFTLALVCAVPLSFLTIVAVVAYGPWAGVGIVMAGGLLAAAVSFEAGKWLGHALVTRLAGPRVNAISQKLARRGVLAVIAIRLVPVAPFAIVNLIAGTLHIKRHQMLLGSAIGMLPGTLVMAVFIDQIVGSMNRPGAAGLGLAILVLALILGGGVVVFRFLKQPLK